MRVHGHDACDESRAHARSLHWVARCAGFAAQSGTQLITQTDISDEAAGMARQEFKDAEQAKKEEAERAEKAKGWFGGLW